MQLKKISAYTVYVNPEKDYYWIRVRLEDHEPEIQDINCRSVEAVNSMVDLLRNEAHTLYDIDSGNMVIGWEPTGEHAPKP